MARRSLSSLEQISEINMTPLMDLTFILLITFIITFPLLEQGIPVNLPKGEAEPVQDQEHRSVTLNREGDLFLDETAISVEALADTLGMASQVDPGMTVYLRADIELPYGDVMKVMQKLHAVGVTRLALMTEEEGN